MTYGKDFVSRYMEACNLEESEAPAIYHRWTCLSIMGAFMGRDIYIQFGTGPIYPNQFVLLMGSPGTRKGTAMSVGRKILKAAQYARFSADKTSKERFLMDMKQFDKGNMDLEDLENLVIDAPSESYVFAPEFVDFIGQGNMEFVTMLTNLWDNLETYKQPKIQGKSVEVDKPTVNMLGGATPDGFSLAFPPEALGGGFLSRVILLHADPTSIKVAWPTPIAQDKVEALALWLKEVKDKMAGQIAISDEAKKVGKTIYETEIAVDDHRFTHYQQRRFIHLLKIAMLLAAFDFSSLIKKEHVIRANTMLAIAEKKMPRALGEFGASRTALASGKILAHLANVVMPQSATDLWKVVSRDLAKMTDLIEILSNLKVAERIQVIEINRKAGYLLMQKQKKDWPPELLDLEWLTPMENF